MAVVAFIRRLCRFGPRRQTNERQTMMSGKSGLKVGTAPTVRDNEPMVLSADYVKRLYQNETFSTEDLLALQRKVWFELTIFFRNVLCCPDQRIWTKQTFKVVRGNYGTKHLELNKAFYSTLDWNERRSGGKFQNGKVRLMKSCQGLGIAPFAWFVRIPHFWGGRLQKSRKRIKQLKFQVLRCIMIYKVREAHRTSWKAGKQTFRSATQITVRILKYPLTCAL